jgi:hypothetical protein
MSIFSSRKQKRGSFPPNLKSDRGFLVFANTSEVIRAENLLKAQGWGIRVMGPPPEIRSGCDLGGIRAVISQNEIECLRSLKEIT